MSKPPLDSLKDEAQPQLAAALRAARQAIIHHWREMVRALLPSADELTRQELENSIPDLLSELAEALEVADPRPTDELVADAPVHGLTRFHQRFNLNELLIEYMLLRRVIIEQVGQRFGRELTQREIVSVNTGVDVMVRRAVLAFTGEQAAELRLEAGALTKYLSFLSHDIRGGLNGVLLMIEVLKRDLATEEKFAASIADLDSMRRLLLETVGTMDRFLSAERLRRGKMPVRLGPVNLRELLNEIVRSFSYQARERGLAMELDVPEQCVIVSDRELLTLIVQNLVGNAVKYSSKGTVRVSACRGSEGTSEAITVSDNGPGIAPEKLNDLFKPFTRGETHGQSGSGLGLTIVRQAADLLGARVTAESTLGVGTTFRVELAAPTTT